jgi:hypothetical protein
MEHQHSSSIGGGISSHHHHHPHQHNGSSSSSNHLIGGIKIDRMQSDLHSKSTERGMISKNIFSFSFNGIYTNG